MNIIILGAGGQSQAVLEAISFDKRYKILGYLDSNIDLHGKYISGIEVLGDMDYLEELVNTKNVQGAIVAIGNSNSREKYIKILKELNLEIINAIHPKAIISERSEIGEGVFIGAGVFIGPYVKIGHGCIINVNSVLPHYNIISNYVNIAPSVAMGGGTTIGENTFVGIGASLKQYINIGSNVIIGAGSVVINDIEDNCTVVGIPARTIKVK